MSPRTGRPVSGAPKDIQLKVRVDKQFMNDVEECAKALNISKSDVIRKGVELVKKSIK